MRRSLTLHPDFSSPAVSGIVADIDRPRPTELRLRYLASGRLANVRIPAQVESARADELWKHTCFEAFLRGADDTYYEFNFAPSTQWAAYEFSGYRTGMKIVGELSGVAIATVSDHTKLDLQVSLVLNRLPKLSGDIAWRAGLSAVIEETNGQKSYWALAHPPGKPDFHHSDCFVLALPSASRS